MRITGKNCSAVIASYVRKRITHRWNIPSRELFCCLFKTYVEEESKEKKRKRERRRERKGGGREREEEGGEEEKEGGGAGVEGGRKREEEEEGEGGGQREEGEESLPLLQPETKAMEEPTMGHCPAWEQGYHVAPLW